MKRDSDIISDLMHWLFQQPASGEPNPSGDVDFPVDVSGQPIYSDEASDRASSALNRFDVGNHGTTDYDIDDLEAFEVNQRSGTNPIFNSGDIPAVQNHFESLLKRRLRQEIEHNPPLFPWETAMDDYPDVVTSDVAAPSVWLNHLHDLDIPSALPDEVLSCLLTRCQDLTQQTLQSGVRLIKAVETLFPDPATNLDPIARMVMMPAYRSAPIPLAELDYVTATAPQRAALSMMAARAIFDRLEITLSPRQPEVNREWLTAAGLMTLRVAYDPQGDGALQARLSLPTAGRLQFGTAAQAVAAERGAPGILEVVLAAPQRGQRFPLLVQLDTQDRAPLQFMVTFDPA